MHAGTRCSLCGKPFEGQPHWHPENGAGWTRPTMTAHTPLRSIRIPDATWQAAQARAKDKGETVSDVVRRALERYAKRS